MTKEEYRCDFCEETFDTAEEKGFHRIQYHPPESLQKEEVESPVYREDGRLSP